jgi:hypothetical protein
MTEQRKEFLRKCQFPLAASLAIAPIPQIVYVAVAPVLVPFFWVLPLAYFLLALLSFRIPGKFRMASLRFLRLVLSQLFRPSQGCPSWL